MAEVTAEEILNKISEGHLECTICLNRFNRPKILDCLHNFCVGCLEKYRKTQYPLSAKLPCPLCRKETPITENGIPGLSNNFSLTALVEEFTHQESLVKRQKSRIACEVCEEDEAISRCTDCKEYLCIECQKAHQRAVKTKKHEIATLEDLRSGKVTFKSKMRDEVPKCRKHTTQDICFFCVTCKVLICAVCTALDHSKPSHTYEDIETAELSFRVEAGILLSDAKDSMRKFLVAKHFIDNASQRLDRMLTEVSAIISKRANEDVARIREEESKLQEEVVKIGRERQEVLKSAQEVYSENSKWTDDTLKMAESVLDQASRFELLELEEKLVQNLTDMKDQDIPCPVQSLSLFLAFKPKPVKRSVSLGKLLLEEKWSLKVQFDGKADDYIKTGFKMAASIATFSNSDMVVADFETSNLRIFNPQEKYKHDFFGLVAALESHFEAQLHNPYDLAVTGDDQLIVIDKPLVKVFDATGAKITKFRYSFSPFEGHGPDVASDLSCIAVDKKNRIAVGDAGRKIISLHEIDGSLINKVPAELLDRRLAISDEERFVFSNYEKGKLVSIDFDGREVFCVDTVINGLLLKPAGMCCDHYGDIYIVLHASDELGSGEIHHYSAEGAHMGLVALGLENPLGLTITPSGELAVADMLSVKIYEKECLHFQQSIMYEAN